MNVTDDYFRDRTGPVRAIPTGRSELAVQRQLLRSIAFSESAPVRRVCGPLPAANCANTHPAPDRRAIIARRPRIAYTRGAAQAPLLHLAPIAPHRCAAPAAARRTGSPSRWTSTARRGGSPAARCRRRPCPEPRRPGRLCPERPAATASGRPASRAIALKMRGTWQGWRPLADPPALADRAEQQPVPDPGPVQPCYAPVGRCPHRPRRSRPCPRRRSWSGAPAGCRRPSIPQVGQ